MSDEKITPKMIELIPDLANWGDSLARIEEWTAAVGNYELAVGYSRVFWPRIVAFRDYVLLEAYATDEAVEPWENACPGDKRAVEAVLNHIHMVDLHWNGSTHNEAQLIELGRTFKEIFQAKLAWAFPDARFQVEFDDTPGLLPEEYQVTFWKVRD
jgi:hypothetical protein